MDQIEEIFRTKLDLSECPEHEPFHFERSVESILEWAHAIIDYDELTVKRNGEVKQCPYWSLVWPKGSICIHFDEEWPRRVCAAMFIYLYSRGISCDLAIDLAHNYTQIETETTK